MSRHITQVLSVALLLAAVASRGWTAEAIPECLPAVSVPLTAHIGDALPVAALLQGGIETPLTLVEAGSGRLLWSAAAHSATTQVFADMTAAFFGSLSAIDLDADGLHDRIYAGDIAGRVWRLDLHHGAAASQWASGGVFADFTNQEGRGFLAAPDVSLSAPPGGAPRLNIAIGTAAPGNARANNRFYALRDHAVYDRWNDEDYEAWQPLREDDLSKVDRTVQAMADAATFMEAGSPGWYVELGSGHVVTPSLTVDHRVVLAIAAHLPRGGSCEVLTRIASIELEQGRLVPIIGTPAEWRTALSAPVELAAAFSLGSPEGGISPCTLGGQRVAACDVDTRPRKTWWRRGDAE